MVRRVGNHRLSAEGEFYSLIDAETERLLSAFPIGGGFDVSVAVDRNEQPPRSFYKSSNATHIFVDF